MKPLTCLPFFSRATSHHGAFVRASALSVLCLTALLSACGGCDGDEPDDADMHDLSVVSDAGDLDMADATADSPDGFDGEAMRDASDDMREDADMKPPIVITPETPEQELLLAAPQQGEAWTLPGLAKPAHVVYTEMGRPHVYAEDDLDMARVLGFVVARDRFFLMDLQRRLGQGRLSELLGDAALSNDVESRHTGMSLVTERLLANLSPEMEDYLDAYVSGINAYIEAVRARKADPPSEFVTFKLLLGARREADMMVPFTRRDVAAMVAVIMYETNFETGDVGRTARYARLQQLYQDDQAPLAALRREGAVEDVWKRGIAPLFPASSVSGWTIEQGSGTTGARPAPGQVSDSKAKKPGSMRLDVDLLDRAHARLDALSDRLGKRELDNFGSNTWAVAGTHSTDGSGIVAGDGHLPLDLPALMYQIGLDTRTFGPNASSEDGLRQTGLLITSLPILAVGTNGHIAWSQVNPFADITDWYLEELELDGNGLPLATRFEGGSRPLEVVDEVYEIANVPVLESVGRTETIRRYVTFDGRLIFDVEGDVYSKDTLPAGSAFVFNGSDYIVPADTNADGVITAISFDYTAFDTTQYLDVLRRLSHAKDVREYQEQTKGFIGNMLYSAVTDSTGSILFTSYQAVPCRSYLARDANDAAQWAPGAHPAMLLDGKTYKGFEIQSLANGFVDESQNQSDPYRCAVPFAETPQAIDPDEGFVFNGNNQPAPITNDASLGDDPWYIGGPWRAVRGDSIEQGLQAVTADRQGSIEAMASLQAERRSRTAEMFLDHFLAAIVRAEALSANPGGSPEEVRLGALYQANKAAFDEIYQRLSAWQMAGLHTDSGVDTFYNTSTEQSRQNAVATMIFNAWLPRVMQGTFDDETLEYYSSSSVAQMRTLKRMLDGRGDNATQLASYNEVTGESAFFDVLSTAEIEQSDEVILSALEGAVMFLSSPGDGEGSGGFGTDEMDAWLWGLRHQARFASILASFFGDTDFGAAVDAFAITTKVLPLAADLQDGDPRKELKWFPRPGDNFAVDAANPGFSGTQFTHGSGPVMRMVISLKDGEVKGQNIIPGGQSAINDSEHFDDQVQLWLENKTIPLRYTPAEVAEGAVGRELFVP